MKERRIDLDLIRTIAILFVISVHSISYIGFYSINDNSIILYILHLLRTLFITCVPLFIILSGYLYGDKEIPFNFIRCKKLLKLILIYILAGLICSFPKIIKGEIVEVIVSFFTFKAAPYAWYLAMYIGLFLLMPLLNNLYNSLKKNGGDSAIKYLIITMIIIIIIPTLLNNFNFNSDRWWDGSINDYTAIVPNYWDQLYPIFYYFIGIYLHDIYIYKFKKIKILLLCLIFCFLFGTLNFFTNINSTFTWNWAVSYGGYQTAIISILLFVLLLGLRIKSNFIIRIISNISKYSFGMYLVSYVFDVIVYKIIDKMNLLISIKFLLMPISVFIIFICSYILSFILYKIVSLFKTEQS